MHPSIQIHRARFSLRRAVAILGSTCFVLACNDARATDAVRRSAKGYASLYDDSTLAYWQHRYEPNLRADFDQLLGLLREPERATLRGLTLDIPLRDDGDPFAYYAEGGSRIVMSALSIKFFDDIAQATSWLLSNNYSNESVAYYVSVLKCRGPESFPHGRYTPPLRALGIPTNVLADSFVNDVSLKVLNGAIVFTLAHELGHIVLQHTPAGTSAAQQLQESEADNFAVNMFRRLATPPMGVETLFFAATYMSKNRGDFSSDKAYADYIAHASHPVTGARLKALASALRRHPEDFAKNQPNLQRSLQLLRSVTMQIDSLGSLYRDPDLQRHTAIVCQQIPLSELGPRRVEHSWFPTKDL